MTINIEDRNVFPKWSLVDEADGYELDIIDKTSLLEPMMQFDYDKGVTEAMLSISKFTVGHEYIFQLFSIEEDGRKSETPISRVFNIGKKIS